MVTNRFDDNPSLFAHGDVAPRRKGSHCGESERYDLSGDLRPGNWHLQLYRKSHHKPLLSHSNSPRFRQSSDRGRRPIFRLGSSRVVRSVHRDFYFDRIPQLGSIQASGNTTPGWQSVGHGRCRQYKRCRIYFCRALQSCYRDLVDDRSNEQSAVEPQGHASSQRANPRNRRRALRRPRFC